MTGEGRGESYWTWRKVSNYGQRVACFAESGLNYIAPHLTLLDVFNEVAAVLLWYNVRGGVVSHLPFSIRIHSCLHSDIKSAVPNMKMIHLVKYPLLYYLVVNCL